MEERNLLDYIYVLVKWRRLIIGSVVVVALVTAGISLILPQTWTAETILIPPEEEGDAMALSSLIGQALPAGLGGLVGGEASGERLVTLLESDRILGAMVDRFSLVQEYGSPYRDEAIRSLKDLIESELGRDTSFKILVNASRPELAAELANAIAAELDAVNRSLKRQQAEFLRAFLEQRVEKVRQELMARGKDLQSFQEQHGLIHLEAQTQGVFEVLKSVVIDLTVAETKLAVVENLLGQKHEERVGAKLEVDALRRQLEGMVGDAANQGGAAASLGPALSRLPELGFEFTRLGLEVKIREEVLHFLVAKLEQAKYRETFDSPTLQVLDVATPPKSRTAPRRTLMVLIGAALALVASVVLAFTFEMASRLGRDNQPKLDAIKEAWRGTE